MSKKIPEETREKIQKLYNEGLKPSEITQQIGISYSTVYGLTRARQRINPETGKPFASETEYRNYHVRQKDNPETGKPFESQTEYENYHARQRKKNNKELSDLLRDKLKELDQNQTWLAKQLGVTRQAISLYFQGKSMPKGKRLDALLNVLNIDRSRVLKSLDDIIEE